MAQGSHTPDGRSTPSSLLGPHLGRLKAALEALPVGLAIFDADDRYLLWNARYAQINHGLADRLERGAALDDVLRTGIERGIYLDGGRGEDWIVDRVRHLRAGAGAFVFDVSDGRRWLADERPLAGGLKLSTLIEVTGLTRQGHNFQALFDHNPTPLILFDVKTHAIITVNRATCETFGYADVALVGRSIDVLFDEPLRLDGSRPDSACRARKADGAVIYTTTFCNTLLYEGRSAILLAAVDITERRRAEARLSYMARHDALTNLPNRTLFRERVEECLARVHEPAGAFAIFLFDLDHFKTVNDTLGHSLGDKLLQEVGRRVQGCAGARDLVARLGGDEFAVIHSGPDVETSVAALVETIIVEMRRPYDLEGHQVQIGASVGVALAPRDGEDPDRLLKNADLALYAAKGRGRGVFLFFEPAMDELLQQRRKLEIELRAAVMDGDLDLHYQPLINLRSGEASGFEALLRWRQRDGAYVPPDVFVPLAEDTGLIGVIGQMALHRACADAARWPNDLKVAVNLSPVQFKSCNVLETVLQALASSGLAPHRLELEITEALLLERDDGVVSALNGLRSIGVGISLDDFGTGYSSLSYLRAFPVTKIKIDQSFIKNLHANPDSQAIVRAIVSLGANLGLSVLAEGIEDQDDLAFLIQEGCAEGQGFYFSAARPVEDLFPSLDAREPTTVSEPLTKVPAPRRA